jgi:hypothetical protein
MKVLKYGKFFEAFLGKDKEEAIKKIISYITSKSKIDLSAYNEIYHIQKDNLFLEGQLFLSIISNKGLRINWIQSDLRNEIHSIDLWDNFEFDKNPEWTLDLNGNSISKSLHQILEFFNNPGKFVLKTNHLQIQEKLQEGGDRLKELEDKLKRARSPEKKEKLREDIARCKASRSIEEKRELTSDKIKQHDLEFDVFKAIELYTIQVAKKKSNSLIISGMAGVGKCHGKGTKILMHNGSIKKVEDVEIGDLIMGDDSSPRKVISLGRGKDTIYKIKSKGWDDFTVNSEHILVLRQRDKKENKPYEITMKEWLKKPESFKRRSQLIRTSVEFQEKEISMDPYLMGIWIGDGSRKSPFAIETADEEIVEFLHEKSIEYNLSIKKHLNKESKSDGYYFSSGSKGKGLKRNRNGFLNDLKSYNLYNCEEKFIPNDYLINSSKVRKSLLAGLIDSDGYQFNKSYSISTKWPHLANQIVFLCRSLGYKSHIHEKLIKDKIYFNVNISGDLSDLPIRLKRKKSEKRSQIKNILHSSFTVSEIGNDNYYGFEIDKNKLYLLGDFTITHNTQVVKETLKSIGMVPDVHYYFATGTVTTAGLYDVLFLNRSNLIIFDDCDAVFKDPDSVNMLKGALDTYEVREISKLTKGNTFDSKGMSDEEIETTYQEDPKKLPNKFEFRGQIIFISNLPEEKFDDAIISRSLHVDVHLNKTEIIQRMRDIMKKISPELDENLKSEALEYLVHVTENFPVKFDLNIRTLIHSINLRAGNDEEMTLGGKSEKVWKLLIKKYLVKTKKY